MASSVNVTVTVDIPLETVATILAADRLDHNSHTFIQIASKATGAVIDAVKDLPDDIKRKSTAHAESIEPRAISVSVRTLTGGQFTVDGLTADTRTSELANRVEEHEGIPPEQQILVFGGSSIHSGRENEEVDMSLNEVYQSPAKKPYLNNVVC